MQGTLRRLWKDEEGASLVFAAITLFSLALCIAYVYQMGVVSTERIQIQNAADAAAYSAAEVEANSLNSIGQVNDAMAYLNYLMLRYTADAIVYDTLHAYESHNRPGASGQLAYVQMGGPQGNYEGPARYRHIQRITQSVIPQGRTWMADLHNAGRAIMNATPGLVRKTAIEIAEHNGAAKIAISEDLERAFRVGGNPGDGFGENSASVSGNTFEESLYRRYGERQLYQVDKATSQTTSAAAQRLPGGWFDPSTGKLRGQYFQIRVCWNAKDWEHAGHTPQHGSFYPFSQYRDGSPNGHWHKQHLHYTLTPYGFIPIGSHGGGGSGGQPNSDNPGGHYLPEDDDPGLHSNADDIALMGPYGEHHWVTPDTVCPTCRAVSYSPSAKWSEVAKTSDDANSLRGFFNLQYPTWPRPLMIRASLLQSGITVAAWSAGSSLGDTFPGTGWGVLAVATAQVGYQTDAGVLPLADLQQPGGVFQEVGGTVLVQGSETIPVLSGQGVDPRNLFYSNGQGGRGPGVRFGARLVPIAFADAHHPDLSYKSLANLLEPGSTRWYDTNNPNAPGTAPTGLDKLKEVVEVDSDTALEAFWH